MLFKIIASLLIAILLFCFYLLYRNNKVEIYSMYWLEKDFKKYLELPSYDYMLFNIFYKLEIPNE